MNQPQTLGKTLLAIVGILSIAVVMLALAVFKLLDGPKAAGDSKAGSEDRRGAGVGPELAEKTETTEEKAYGLLKIVSWNIEWYPTKRFFPEGQSEGAQPGLVMPELAKMSPDVLLAQEIRDWQAFEGLCDVVDGLRPLVVSAFRSDRSGEYWRQQLCIGARTDAVAGWAEPWSAGQAETPPRGFSAAVLRLPDREDYLLVYCIHLKSNRSSNEEEARRNYRLREESVRQLLAHVDRMETEAFPGQIVGIVVGGDFNTNDDGQFAGDRTVEMMESGGFYNTWQGVERKDRLTWRGNRDFEATTFDYLFTKGLPEVQARLVPVDGGCSDHWPLEIVIDLEKLGN